MCVCVCVCVGTSGCACVGGVGVGSGRMEWGLLSDLRNSMANIDFSRIGKCVCMHTSTHDFSVIHCFTTLNWEHV